MKISIIGGGGTRTPLLCQGLLKQAKELGIDQIYLTDNNPQRLSLIGKVINTFVSDNDKQPAIVFTDDMKECLQDSSFVFNTIRVGGEDFRILDEKIPLKYDLIGQETVGAGGFAMAIRNIPVILEITKLMQQYCDNAWLINFTNPSGIITQAVHSYSDHNKVIGICDVPETIISVISRISGKAEKDIYLDYYGLNHLGWAKGVYIEGKDHLALLLKLIGNYPEFDKLYGIPARFLQEKGWLANPYLNYYYFTQVALETLKQTSTTRGEEVKRINDLLFEELTKAEDVQKTYFNYLGKREDRIDQMIKNYDFNLQEGEGYIQVAMKILRGLTKGGEIAIINIPNRGAISGLGEEDIVEIPAYLGKNLIRPLSVGTVPPENLMLIQKVKNYENKLIKAVSEKSVEGLILALASNPLVGSLEVAKNMFEDFCNLEKDYFSVFRHQDDNA